MTTSPKAYHTSVISTFEFKTPSCQCLNFAHICTFFHHKSYQAARQRLQRSCPGTSWYMPLSQGRHDNDAPDTWLVPSKGRQTVGIYRHYDVVWMQVMTRIAIFWGNGDPKFNLHFWKKERASQLLSFCFSANKVSNHNDYAHMTCRQDLNPAWCTGLTHICHALVVQQLLGIGSTRAWSTPRKSKHPKSEWRQIQCRGKGVNHASSESKINSLYAKIHSKNGGDEMRHQ